MNPRGQWHVVGEVLELLLLSTTLVQLFFRHIEKFPSTKQSRVYNFMRLFFIFFFSFRLLFFYLQRAQVKVRIERQTNITI